MNNVKGVRFWHIIVCLSAILLLIFLSVRLNHSISKLRDLRNQLLVSRNTWEEISNEKEALQKELVSLTDQIREAQLTISESQEKMIDLTSENSKLKQEISALQTDP